MTDIDSPQVTNHANQEFPAVQWAEVQWAVPAVPPAAAAPGRSRRWPLLVVAALVVAAAGVLYLFIFDPAPANGRVVRHDLGFSVILDEAWYAPQHTSDEIIDWMVQDLG